MYRIRPAHGHEVTGCSCYDNDQGIYISHLVGVNITGCVCNHNENGIKLYSDWDRNIDRCTLNYNTVGLYLRYGSDCVLTNTTIIGNEYGIHGHDASRNKILNCIIDSNTYGVKITTAIKNTFDNCSCSHNDVGMEFINNEKKHWDDEGRPYIDYHGSNKNVFTNNVFEENKGYALNFSVHCSNNKIHYNDFIRNNWGGVQAFDNGTDNVWNNTDKGNHWSDWTTPDRNNNGIVDYPYPIDGEAQAYDHLPITTPGQATGGSGGLTGVGWAIVFTVGFLIFLAVIAVVFIKVLGSREKKVAGGKEDREKL